MTRRAVVITIDGPVAAGKGTLARRIARDRGYAYLDTGSLYRATALRLIRGGANQDDPAAASAAAAAIEPSDLDDPALRDEAVGNLASKVAAMPEVRHTLLEFQRNFASHPPDGAAGAVLDGRDTGTVVCPGADAKLFVTASMDERARRRYLELRSKGADVDEATVRADLEARDARDSARTVAPLTAAPDAYLLDTSNLAIDSAFQAAKSFVDEKLA
jgi:cytidylate kinase